MLWKQTVARSSEKRTVFGGLVTILSAWYRRERERRELSKMSPRDFGDLRVPLSLVLDEMRRWPWQKPSPHWSDIASWRPTGSDSGGECSARPQQKRPTVSPVDGGEAAHVSF